MIFVQRTPLANSSFLPCQEVSAIQQFFLSFFSIKSLLVTKIQKDMTTNFFSPLSFVAVFGSGIGTTRFGIQDPGSGMGKNQDTGSGINIPDPPHWALVRYLRKAVCWWGDEGTDA